MEGCSRRGAMTACCGCGMSGRFWIRKNHLAHSSLLSSFPPFFFEFWAHFLMRISPSSLPFSLAGRWTDGLYVCKNAERWAEGSGGLNGTRRRKGRWLWRACMEGHVYWSLKRMSGEREEEEGEGS